MLVEFPSYDECKDAVNNMIKENSPGLDNLKSEFYQIFRLDCLTSEFYQTFWSEIGFIFYEVLKDIYN